MTVQTTPAAVVLEHLDFDVPCDYRPHDNAAQWAVRVLCVSHHPHHHTVLLLACDGCFRQLVHNQHRITCADCAQPFLVLSAEPLRRTT
jgi:hypothetical protein